MTNGQSDAPGQHKEITIIVNGKKKTETERDLTFRQVVTLAFPDATFDDTTIFTVTYKRGQGKKPEGTMVDGDTVRLHDGMIFNVTRTSKS